MARKSFTKKQRAAVYEKCGGHCAYCGIPIEVRHMQVDHVLSIEMYEAVTHGMDYSWADVNGMYNLLPACRSCNYIKSTMTVEKFRRIILRWPDTLYRDSVTYKNALRFGLVKQVEVETVQFYYEKIGIVLPDGDVLTGAAFYRDCLRREKEIKTEREAALNV